MIVGSTPIADVILNQRPDRRKNLV